MKSKYRNIKTVVDGITFDSRKEAEYYILLKLQEKSGVIRDFKLQPKFELVPTQRICGKTVQKAVYKADFSYVVVKTGKTVVVDVKGFKTAIYMLKKKLMKMVHGIEVVEV